MWDRLHDKILFHVTGACHAVPRSNCYIGRPELISSQCKGLFCNYAKLLMSCCTQLTYNQLEVYFTFNKYLSQSVSVLA